MALPSSTSSCSSKELAMKLKEKGNKLFKVGKYDEAIAKYTDSVELDGINAVVFSNRSLAYLKLSMFKKALEDSIQCIERDPKWIKGYFRKCKAHQGLGNHNEVMQTVEEGFKFCSDSQMKKDMIQCWLMSKQVLYALPPGSIELPRGICILSIAYREILVCLIRSMNGECPLNYDLMEECLVRCSQEVEDILKRFGENHSPVIHDWAKQLPYEVYPFALKKSEDDLQVRLLMKNHTDSLVTFINKKVDPAIYPILRPWFDLVVLIVLNRCNILTENNTSHYSAELMNEALLPLFESSLLAHEDYHSMYIGRICALLDSFIGCGDKLDKDDLNRINMFTKKLQKAITNYPRHLPEFQKDNELAERLLSNVRQNILQPATFHPPSVPLTHSNAMTVELAERLVAEKPVEVKTFIDKHLKELEDAKFLTMGEVEDLLSMAGIFQKLGCTQKARQVFTKGEDSFFKVFSHLLSTNTLTLDQCPTVISPMRQLILNQALLFPDIFGDVSLRWKCLFKEQRLQMFQRSSENIYYPFFEWYTSELKTAKDTESVYLSAALSALLKNEQQLLRAQAEAVLSDQRTLNYKKLLDSLQPGVVTVDYIFFAPLHQEDTLLLDAYCVIGQKEKEPITCRLDFPAILTHTRRLIYLLSNMTEPDEFIKAELRFLSKVLFPNKLLEILAQDNIKQVYISPDFDLSKIPLDILPVSIGDTQEQPLYEIASVSFISSMKRLIAYNDRNTVHQDELVNKSCYIVGNPNFNLQKSSCEVSTMERLVSSFCDYLSISSQSTSCIDYLAHSQSEIDFISFCLQSSKYNVVCLTGDDATFNNVMSIQNPLLLHFSSHAASSAAAAKHGAAVRGNFFIDLDSAVALAGYNTLSNKQFNLLPPECGPAQLPPMAIYSMKLSQTKLVFLSTCNSAAGESPFLEGIGSLADAFITAGVETVIASLWTIPDESAATFFKFFYDKLVQPGVRPSQALAYAKNSFLASSDEWICPNAFICYGMDNPLCLAYTC